VERVLRHPIVSIVAAGGLLVALVIPAFSLHTVNSGVQGLPPELPITKTLKRIQAAFPGGAVPAAVVIQAKDVTSPQVQEGITKLELGALGSGLMAEPIVTRVNPIHSTDFVPNPLAGKRY